MWWSEILIGLGLMVACIVLVYLAMASHVRHAEHAIEVLRKRFARGEINQEEFESRLRVLDA